MQGWWEYKIQACYSSDVKHPKVPGEMVFETVHRGEHSRDMEIDIFRARKDIGKIIVADLRTGNVETINK